MQRIKVILLIFFFISSSLTSKLYADNLPCKINFIRLGTGSFIMGSPKKEKGRARHETEHKVTITEDFFISQTEITQEQWVAVMGSYPSRKKKQGKNYPVTNVSWYEAQEFINKLNQYAKKNIYSLPTEAQWEYAARAGSKTALTNGEINHIFCEKDVNLDKIAWYCGNSKVYSPSRKTYARSVHPVGTKITNAWGLYDMHGNVAEWCQDSCYIRHKYLGTFGVFTENYKKNIKDPLCTIGEYKIVRGGAWNLIAKRCRSAYRSCKNPIVKRNNIGFRIIKKVIKE